MALTVSFAKGANTSTLTSCNPDVVRQLRKERIVIKRAMKTEPKARDRLKNTDTFSIVVTLKTDSLAEYQKLWTIAKTAGNTTFVWGAESFTVQFDYLECRLIPGEGEMRQVRATVMIVSSDST